MRKLRFAAGGRGKSGAFRVIYYVLNDEMPIVAIIIYAKNEKAGPTPEEKRGAQAVVDSIKNELNRRKARH